ncbi:hypothetical protein [Nocardiopsis dassonvillei]|uniref:hypothetical protein n=1 Tax=Nocardiopsis dassonvillei TaxID=2014 RepID=UPI003627E90A
MRWFAAEHPLTGGQPTDIDIRFDADAAKSTDMLRFEPVRDGELVGRVHLPVLVGAASRGQRHYDQVMECCA